MNIEGIDKNLANLMAYVVQVDGTVSNEEISVFNEFLKGRFPEEESKAIFDGFVSALKERPLLESVLDEVRSSYDEDELARLRFVVSLYELISADGITDRELGTFKTVCSFLSIKDENTDLISSLLIPSYQYEFIENVGRKLSAGEDPERFDLVYPGVDLEWVELAGRYFVVNIGSVVPVFVGDKPLYKNRIIELGLQEGEVAFEGGCVRSKDLPTLFELKRTGEKKTLYYRFTGELVERRLDGGSADFRIETDGPRFRLYKSDASPHTLSLGKEGEGEKEEEKGAAREFDRFSYLQLSDSLIINGSFFIAGRDLIFPGEGKELALRYGEGSKTHFVISDSVDQSDIYIDDETEADLLITVDRDKKEGGFQFSLDFKDLPYAVPVGNKEFQTGEQVVLTENSTMVVGRNQIFFNALDGTIQAGEINFHRFEVKNLVYRFSNGNLGIDNVSFAVEKGNLISIMGASGSGKSTLMQLLLGYLSPTSGEVTINDHDFHKNFDTLRNYIGYVPQDDLLMENLTVYENLYYTAKVRLPEKTKLEIDYLIDRVLKDLGLQDKKHLTVGSPVEKVLSGGQRKRLNIGLELLADPDLFFLDEPTSGLSSGDSESIVKLLSDLSNREKIVFVVIHQPSSDIYKRFDKLLLLDVGGKLAYFGGAMEGIRYFKQFLPVKDNFIECPSCGNANPEIIFTVLEQKEKGKDGLPIFKEKKDFGKGVPGLMRRLLGKPMIVQEPVRRYDPDYWSRLFLTKEAEQEEGKDSTGEEHGPGIETTPSAALSAKSLPDSIPAFTALPPKPRRNILTSMKGTLGYFSRNLRDKIKDRSNMMMTLLVPLLLGLLMSFLLKGGKVPYLFPFNDEYTKYLFLSVVIFIFFGLMASVNEVIRDRPILHREKIIGTKPRQYLFSKIGVYAIFAALQVTLYALPGFIVLEIPWRMPAELAHIPSSFFSLSFFPYFLIAGFLTIYASFALGLFLSSMVKSQLAAFNIIPLIIVPQIIFGGMFVQFADMPSLINRDVPAYANLTFSRWGYEALLSGSEMYNPLRPVTDADIIKDMQEAYKGEGRYWDYQEIISGPLRSMKEAPAGPLPKGLSYSVFEEHFKEYISDNDPDLWDKGKHLFTLNDTGDFVYLPEGPTEEDSALVKELFRRAAPDGFYTKYQLFQGNRNVRQAIFDSRSLDWLNKLSSAGAYHPRDWVVGQNVFPAHDKILGPYRFATVWFNLGVLLVISLLLHFATALRLKRL